MDASPADLLMAALADPFRIGLLVALFATMVRTRAATGTLVPLLAGAVFVAVIIPATMRPPAPGEYLGVVVAGFVVNLAVLAAIALLWRIAERLRR
jgi:peptidoglycan/LPS O-acetylase OafA/YrhL